MIKVFQIMCLIDEDNSAFHVGTNYVIECAGKEYVRNRYSLHKDIPLTVLDAKVNELRTTENGCILIVAKEEAAL